MKLTRRRAAALVAGPMMAAGLAVSVLTASGAAAATIDVGPYQANTNPTDNLTPGTNVSASVSQPAAVAGTAVTVEIHLCNTGDIFDQFTYGYTADGACTDQLPPGASFSNPDVYLGQYAIPPGETTSSFTYNVGTGNSPDGKVTTANEFLVYRVTDNTGGEFYAGQQLTFVAPTTTTSTTLPTTTTTTTLPTTTTTTLPTTTTSTTTTTKSTTTTTKPTTTTTKSTTTTTKPTTTTNPICKYWNQIPTWLQQLITQIFGVTCR